MNQVDRLEALAEEMSLTFIEGDWDDVGFKAVADALPDLIRVARAAKDFLEEGSDLDGERLEKALVPLYREVEQ